MNQYQVYCVRNGGEWVGIPAIPVKIDGFPDRTFFVHKILVEQGEDGTPVFGSEWAVSEMESGLSLAEGRIKKLAVAKAIDKLSKVTPEWLDELIAGALKKRNTPVDMFGNNLNETDSFGNPKPDEIRVPSQA